MKTLELFQKIEGQQKLPAHLLLQGEDPYLSRELKDALKKENFEISEMEIKKNGPDGASEDLCLGSSLFSSRSFVWLKKASPPSQWKAAAKSTFTRMLERADGDSLIIALQVASDKRVNWSSLGLGVQYPFPVEPRSRIPWLSRMNEKRGSPLGKTEIDFLLSFDADLMTLDNWIELWALGGSLWAERSLGWNPEKRVTKALSTEKSFGNFSGNPAFSWVDAVLQQDAHEASRVLNQLEEKGQEPLQLLALLSKSVRILAQLEEGHAPQDQPEFLVNKMKTQMRSMRDAARGRRLLKACAELDRLLKSSPIQAFASLANLATLS